MESKVWKDSTKFEYYGVTKAFHPDFVDREIKISPLFVPKKFVVIQMN